MSEIDNEINKEESVFVPSLNSTVTNLYDYEQATILIGLQILPVTNQPRQVLITAGIKGELPTVISTSIEEITQSTIIAQALEQVKLALPLLATKAQNKAENLKATIIAKAIANKKLPIPELPVANPNIQSDQLSLFQ